MLLHSAARAHTDLGGPELDHLARLAGDWQILADLSFADLLLFAPCRQRDAYIILAQVRPYPAQTLYTDDMVGQIVEARARAKVTMAAAERRIVREGDPEWRDGIPVREEAIPVVLNDRVIAVVSAEQNLATARTPSQLELSYLQAAGDLAQMVAEGTFPFAVELEEQDVSPRVGDGFIRLEEDMTVRYASPNAVSAYRRISPATTLVGEHIGELGIDERATLTRIRRGEPVENEIELGGSWILRRFLPIMRKEGIAGALVLVRDITDLRRRDRLLLLKDATIREIHHRVKNNLQTVAALLRLQARRLPSAEARNALQESVRRITSIAIVHETLSLDSRESVQFDRVAERLVALAKESLAAPERPIRFTMTGRAGDLPSEVATPLAIVIAELIQNAVEHAFSDRGGSVRLELTRDGRNLSVAVVDEGGGLPEGFSLDTDANLGLQIVRTLVTTELGGDIVIEPEPGGGTRACVSIRVGRGQGTRSEAQAPGEPAI